MNFEYKLKSVENDTSITSIFPRKLDLLEN